MSERCFVHTEPCLECAALLIDRAVARVRSQDAEELTRLRAAVAKYEADDVRYLAKQKQNAERIKRLEAALRDVTNARGRKDLYEAIERARALTAPDEPERRAGREE